MDRNKCLNCGLVNVITDDTCRRCRASLKGNELVEEVTVEDNVQGRSLGRRLIWIVSATVALLFMAYMSLLLTSDDLGYESTQTVNTAIALLAEKGFDKQAFVLNRLARYRGPNNWWNRYLGHPDAY